MRISILFVVALLLCQCAKKDDDNLQELADKSFDHLMQRDFPAATKLASGMYIEWLRDEPGTTVVEGDWLMLNYRGTNFRGDVFSTRYRDEAIHPENTFTWRTRYTPHYLEYNKSTFVLSPGEFEAVALMSKGDSVRLYIPTKLGYGYSAITFQYGYEGWLNTSANPNAVTGLSNIPVIVELSLKDTNRDPKTVEFNDMQAKAIELGFDISATSPDMVTDSLFFHYTTEDLTQGFIGKDSTVYITYTGRFLDNFVLRTNDPLVAENELMDTRNSYVPLLYPVYSPPTTLSEAAIKKVMASGKVRYNSEIRIIFTSAWGYGTTGLAATSTNPVVYPYTPLYFDIKTYPWGYDPDATE